MISTAVSDRALATMSVLEVGMTWFGEQPGGLDRYYTGLIQNSEQAGLHVKGLVVGSSKTAVESNGRVVAFAPIHSPLLRRMRAARSAASHAIREESFDLWASHFALYALPLLQKLRHLPHVVHFHGPWAQEGRQEGDNLVSFRAKAILERRVYRSADRLIVLSNAFRRLLCSQYGIEEDRVRVVPGGIDVDRFDIGDSRNESRQSLGWPTDRPIVLCVRRLVRRMGLHLLIGAVKELQRKHPALLCLIGGTGPLKEELESAVAEAGLGAHIKLLGFIPDESLPMAYRAADLTVVPSEAWEGFGLIAAESLAAGTPVIVTPVGGLPEVVRPLSSSLVTAEVSASAIAECLDKFLSSPDLLPHSTDCVDYVKDNFNWATVAQKVAAVYREVC